MASGRCTAQVIFLIDCNVHSQLSPTKAADLYKLACVRFLSSFKYNPAYKQLRWSYRFYSLHDLPLATRRHTAWKDFSTQTFDEFGAILADTLSKSSPVDDSSHNEGTEDLSANNRTLAAKYANVLCAVIEDFQWEIPDISSPVKSVRRARTATSTVENYVFNLHPSPVSTESLATFIGVDCKRPSQLLRAIMSATAKQKWIEKRMRLFWVDTSPAAAGRMEDPTRDLCVKALRDLNGDVLSLYQIVQLKRSTSLLSAMSDSNNLQEAPVTSVCRTIAKLLEPQERREKCLSTPLNICWTDNKCILKLRLHSLAHSSQLPVEYLYISGRVSTHSIRLHHLNQLITYLCTTGEGDNSHGLSHFLVDMSRDSTVLVLMCKLDGTLYCLKPLTLSTATLTRVNDTCVSLVEEVVKHGSTKYNIPVTSRAYTGALIDPTAQPFRPVERSAAGHRDISSHFERLRDAYRARKLKSKLRSPANSCQQKVDSRPARPSVIKEQHPRLTRGSKCVVAVAEKKRSSLELPVKSAVTPADTDKTQLLPAKKKIVLTTISSLTLSTEEELVSYTTKSYDEACSGKDSLYLTAQKVVNTARVFYKKELNPQLHVEKLLLSHVIKGVAAIRKSCAGDSDRKCRECQMSTLLLLELEVLNRELSVEGAEETDINSIVSNLEEYLTCMSLGKPHLLKEFITSQLIPSYQLTLATVLAALLTEFGQDMPTSLKRLMAAEMEQRLPSLNSVNSKISSLPSPAMIPSFNSLFSEPGNSLMSSSMACGRSLQVRSMSDKGRRSIAVPGELLKKSRRGKRLSSRGVASRTRSKTPKKDGEPLLTEFPTGFLSKLKEGAQSVSAVRRSPRLAGLSQPAVSAATKVKRDLFSSPTTSARRTTARSPRRPKARQGDTDRRVLVAETPLHKQSYGNAGPQATSPSITEVVEETPAKAVAERVEAVTTKPVTHSSHKRLSRRKSFYDMERVKSRNVEKFEKLEDRMKCSLSAKCSPRRAAKLILKQALSQPIERVATRLTPSKDSSTSPVKRLPRIHRKSTGSNSAVAEENIEPKALRKKKLFASPHATLPTVKSDMLNSESIIQETPEKTLSSLQPTKTLANHNKSVSDDVMACADAAGMETDKTAPGEQGCPSGAEPVHSLAGGAESVYSPAGGAEFNSRKRQLSDESPLTMKTPIKGQPSVCTCCSRTPRGARRSPRSCPPSQRKVCQFANGEAADAHKQVCCGDHVSSATSSPSPRRLHFLSRKRGTDPLAQDVKTSNMKQSDESIKALSTTESSCAAKTHPSFLSPTRASSGAAQRVTPQHRKVQRSHTSPKYSPLSAGDLQSLLRSPFVRLENEGSSHQD